MVEGSIDLTWAVKAKPWELRLGAAMLRPYFPIAAAMLDLRADRQDPERRDVPRVLDADKTQLAVH